ncbi:MAG: chorismate synthase, partial [Prevotella sp.]|nr:chorismate synthase [Prevotella sp.]
PRERQGYENPVKEVVPAKDPAIMTAQPTLDTTGQPATLEAHGRHDPCVVPRAIPIVEAMAAMTVFDFYLLSKIVK